MPSKMEWIVIVLLLLQALYSKRKKHKRKLFMLFGGNPMPSPDTFLVGQSVPVQIVETAAGVPVTVDFTNVTVVSDNETVATVTFDAATGIATVVGVSAGTVNITAADSKFTLTKTDALVVTALPIVPDAIDMQWGTPV